jgi:hypothetical protein
MNAPDPLTPRPSTHGRVVARILLFAVCAGFALVAVVAFRDLRVAIALHVRDAYMKKPDAVTQRMQISRRSVGCSLTGDA